MVGEIYDLKRFCLHDGPGIRTTAFLKGCPLRCLWCHNPEGIKPGRDIWVKKERCIGCQTCVHVCPYGAVSMGGNGIVIDKSRCEFCDKCVHACPPHAIARIDSKIGDDELVELLLEDRVFYEVSGGGVTLSGGEPLLQSAFSAGVLKKLKERGVDTCIEACMFAERGALDQVIPFVDHFLVDIKLYDDALHKRYTGVSNERILDNFGYLAGKVNDILVRIPLIPGITATEDNIRAIARFVKRVSPLARIELINYNTLAGSKYKLLGMDFFDDDARAFSSEEMARFESMLTV